MERAEILKLKEQNTVIELAERFGVSRATIYNWLHQAGWQPKDNSIDGFGNCEECAHNPRARGLCASHYGKAWREGILDRFPIGKPVWRGNLKTSRHHN